MSTTVFNHRKTRLRSGLILATLGDPFHSTIPIATGKYSIGRDSTSVQLQMLAPVTRKAGMRAWTLAHPSATFGGGQRTKSVTVPLNQGTYRFTGDSVGVPSAKITSAD
jgi:hypothetical protein